jgi:hypothetical protein
VLSVTIVEIGVSRRLAGAQSMMLSECLHIYVSRSPNRRPVSSQYCSRWQSCHGDGVHRRHGCINEPMIASDLAMPEPSTDSLSRVRKEDADIAFRRQTIKQLLATRHHVGYASKDEPVRHVMGCTNMRRFSE